MSSEKIFKSLDFYSKINRHMSLCPISWDSGNQELVFNPLKKTHWWHFNVYVVTFTVFYGSLAAICLRQYISPEENVSNIVIATYVLGLLLGSVVMELALGLSITGETCVRCFNAIFTCQSKFRQGNANFLIDDVDIQIKQTNLSKTTSQHRRKRLLADLLHPDWFTLSFLSTALFLRVVPAFATVLIVAFDLDPWGSTLENLLPSHLHQNLCVKTLHKILASVILFIASSEGCRIIPMIVIQMVMSLMAYLENIRLLVNYGRNCKSVQDAANLYMLYTELQVANNSALGYVAWQAFALNLVGTVLVLGLLFASVRLYGVLPLPVYLVIVYATVVTMVITYTLSPIAANVYDHSEEALVTWREQWGLNRILKRKFRAMRPYHFYGGVNGFRFYGYQQSFKRMYFSLIVDSTINLLMTFTAENVQNTFSKLNF